MDSTLHPEMELHQGGQIYQFHRSYYLSYYVLLQKGQPVSQEKECDQVPFLSPLLRMGGKGKVITQKDSV